MMISVRFSWPLDPSFHNIRFCRGGRNHKEDDDKQEQEFIQQNSETTKHTTIKKNGPRMREN